MFLDNNVLRRSLACKQFSLKDLRGNRFLSSKYKPIDSCHSSMAISHNGITPFGINLEDLAAYSISYLHKVSCTVSQHSITAGLIGNREHRDVGQSSSLRIIRSLRKLCNMSY